MERHKKITSDYIASLCKQVEEQIELSKTIIAKSKQVVAHSREQHRQHCTEIKTYLDSIKIKI